MWSRFAQSVRYKLILVVLATNFVALLVAGMTLAVYELRNYRNVLVNDLTAQSEILGRASAPALQFLDPASADAYLRLLEARPQITAAAIYNAKGKLFAGYLRENSATELPSLPASAGHRLQGNALELFTRIVEDSEILGTVYLRANYEFQARLSGYLQILGGVMLLSMLVALLVVTRLQARLTTPILAVTDIAHQVMTKRDYSLRARKTTEDEIGYLVDAFNGMLAEIGFRSEANEATNRKLEQEITDRMRAEADLRELNLELERRVSERTAQLENVNKELEAFSYSVSHDLRAPLRAITGFANLLIQDHAPQLNEEANRKLGVIVGEAQRMGTLIDDLLAFSRLGRKDMQIVELDMTAMVRSTYDVLIQQHEGPAVEMHIAELPGSRGDRVLIGQVWVNLIANALKFSANRARPVVEVNAISDDKEHVYFVRDNGAGFDPRYQAKLFEVFQRLHAASEFAGTGVGLALVKRIITRHGGRVWAEGKPDVGATFYFTLPRDSIDERI